MHRPDVRSVTPLSSLLSSSPGFRHRATPRTLIPSSTPFFHYARSRLVLSPPSIHPSPAITGLVSPFACTFCGMREGHASFTIANNTL